MAQRLFFDFWCPIAAVMGCSCIILLFRLDNKKDKLEVLFMSGQLLAFTIVFYLLAINAEWIQGILTSFAFSWFLKKSNFVNVM